MFIKISLNSALTWKKINCIRKLSGKHCHWSSTLSVTFSSGACFRDNYQSFATAKEYSVLKWLYSKAAIGLLGFCWISMVWLYGNTSLNKPADSVGVGGFFFFAHAILTAQGFNPISDTMSCSFMSQWYMKWIEGLLSSVWTRLCPGSKRNLTYCREHSRTVEDWVLGKY